MNLVYNVFARIAYNGSHFYGWAYQKQESNTLQEKIEKVLKSLFKQNIKVYSCSRTDRGVHALDQCILFQFNSNTKLSNKKCLEILNKSFKSYIRFSSCHYVEKGFNIRGNIDYKTYLYKITKSSTVHDAFKYDTSWIWSDSLFKKLNIDILNKWKKIFLGSHNFLSFINKNSHKKNEYFCREIKSINFKLNSRSLFIFISSPGFGRNMMRMIIGTLYDYLNGVYDFKEIEKFLKKPSKLYKIYNSPPNGLYLYKVTYKK